VINNPLAAASDRTVIGVLSSTEDVKYMLGADRGIKTIDLICVESNLCTKENPFTTALSLLTLLLLI
jgi:hypothetical protein